MDLTAPNFDQTKTGFLKFCKMATTILSKKQSYLSQELITVLTYGKRVQLATIKNGCLDTHSYNELNNLLAMLELKKHELEFN